MSDIVANKFDELCDRYAKKQVALRFDFRKFVTSTLHIKRSDVYSHNIHPMGTKHQAFGLYLYWTTKPTTTSLIYSAPLRHNDLFYSKGIGRTWVLPIK